MNRLLSFQRMVRSLSLVCITLAGAAVYTANAAEPTEAELMRGFKGKIELDVRDSKPDWKPFLPKKAPKGAPNILFILYDDTGQAAWSPYGGRISMPTLDSLAADGLTYTNWHTTSLCSPTRSTLQTGRTHWMNGFANVSEGAEGFPGYSTRFPKEVTTLAEVLQENGYATLWLGKDHNVPETDVAPGGYRGEWPLQKGWDRFYGFLGGETDQWYPFLVKDNDFIAQPYMPDQGYHLSKDLADQAIEMLRNKNASNPSKPFFMWFCPGANHAPHQAPKEWIAKYKGKFNDGYDAYRTWVTKRMKAKGIIPENTVNTAVNPLPKDVANPLDYVRPWNTLNDKEKKLFNRMAEVFAAYSSYTDYQIGRIIDYLKKTGQYENTLIIYAADNGTSGEGSPNGSVNENKFFNSFPDSLADNMKYIDKLGGPDTYEHFPTGWAAAFSAPYKFFKRYSEYEGGTADPLVISWPKGIKAHGELRNQYHHSTDIVPTILEITGLKMPKVNHGVKQYPLYGVSMAYTFKAKPNDPTHKHVQIYEMFGTRGIWKDGWFASAVHVPLGNKSHFDKDKWELYHLAKDRSQSKNLADKYPEKLKELKKLWMEQAKENNVLPLDDRLAVDIINTPRPTDEPPRDTYKYYPGTEPVPEGVAVNIRGRSYKILANVEITDKTEGVIFAMGSRFGGHTLFIKDKKLYYVYNFLGIKPEQVFESDVTLKPGKYTVGMEFKKTGVGEHGESLGTTKLYIDDKVVASGKMRTQPGKFSFSGEGLCVGYDSQDAVSTMYKAPGKFTGGKIQGVAVSVKGKPYVDLEAEAKRLMMTW